MKKTIQVTQADIEKAKASEKPGLYRSCPIYFAIQREPELAGKYNVGSSFLYTSSRDISINLPQEAARLSRLSYAQNWADVLPIIFEIELP